MIQIFAPARRIDDVDLERRVVRYLLAQGVAGGPLRVEASHGIVTLRGKVGSRRWKWLATQCSRRVAGVVQLIDAIEVDAPTDPSLASPRPGWPGPGLLDYVFERNQRHEQQPNSSFSLGPAHSRRGV